MSANDPPVAMHESSCKRAFAAESRPPNCSSAFSSSSSLAQVTLDLSLWLPGLVVLDLALSLRAVDASNKFVSGKLMSDDLSTTVNPESLSVSVEYENGNVIWSSSSFSDGSQVNSMHSLGTFNRT